MVDGMSLKEFMQKEKNKWKEMDGKHRWDYFRYYYLKPCIIVLLIIVVIMYMFLKSFVFNKESIMSGIVYNYELEDEAVESFENGYMEYVGGNPKKQCADIHSDMVSKDEYNSIMKVHTYTGAQAIDFVIVDDYAYEILNDESMFANIEEVLDKSVLEKIDGKIINATDVDTGIEYPAGIDISDTNYAKEYIGGKAYLFFVINSSHLDDMTSLAEYFLEK